MNVMNLLNIINSKKYIKNDEKINIDEKFIANNLVSYPNLNYLNKNIYNKIIFQKYFFYKLFFVCFIFNFMENFKK